MNTPFGVVFFVLRHLLIHCLDMSLMKGTGRFIIKFVVLMCFKRHWPGFFLGVDSSGAGLMESLWIKKKR